MTPQEAIELLDTLIGGHEKIREYLTTLIPPDPPPDPDPTPVSGIWIGPAEIAKLPVEGAAWENLLKAAQQSTTNPNISDQNDATDVHTLAKALVYARTGMQSYRDEVFEAIYAAIWTEDGAGILAVCRNVTAYVIAADLINLREYTPTFDEGVFRPWLADIRHEVFSGAGPSLSIVQCHEIRPNNFGTHAGAARIAIARYLEDNADLDRAAAVFKGWLGDRDSYSGFKFGSLTWQADPENPVGINPAGATIDGRDVDGVLPDDQRRGGGFSWPPEKENYVWEALQGAVVQAELLTRAGYPAWDWCDSALLRAVTWLHIFAEYPAEGDDTWIPWIVNRAYGMFFPAVTPTNPGKGMGWTDWTHGTKVSQ